MTAAIFVDTNVFVYAADEAQGSKQPLASEWLERLWKESSGRSSLQVMNELYVTLVRKIPKPMAEADAWAYVSELLAWRPLGMDGALMTRAHEIVLRYELSWWDSLIVAAAQLQNCALLLTEDLQDGMNLGGVRVVNPFVARVNEPLADVPRYARPSHPPRGRPRGSRRSASPR